MNNIIVIGGGPAGSTVACFLAMKGHDVTVFEKEKFPRDHVGESLIPFIYPIFQDLKLLDKMEASYSRKPGVKFTNHNGENSTVWYFDHVIKDETSLSFHVERASFDKLLLDRAKELGAVVHEETAVKDVDLSDPKSVTVTTRDKDGNEAEHKARFIVDCSGQMSFLANRKLKNKKNYEDLDRVAINTHWKNPIYDKELEEGCIEIVHLGGEKKGWIWNIPLSKDNLSVGVVVGGEYFKQRRQELKGSDNWQNEFYLSELEESGAMKNILGNATQMHDVLINGDYSNYSEQKFGSNFAMSGDCASFLDPIFSSGIYVAMSISKQLSETLGDYLKEDGDLDQTLGKLYTKIDGAYNFVEKLIRIFYDPNAISLANLSAVQEESYDKFHAAYEIYHYMLAGDFFNNHEKYEKALELMKDTKNLEKYKNLIK